MFGAAKFGGRGVVRNSSSMLVEKESSRMQVSTLKNLLLLKTSEQNRYGAEGIAYPRNME